jgi:hypothetical protein
VTDADGDPATIIIDAIRQDEPTGHGRYSPDGFGIGFWKAWVRAERKGNGNGRVYHISFTASDGQGGFCSGTVRTAVAHDQGGNMDDIDGGPLYDSTVED